MSDCVLTPVRPAPASDLWAFFRRLLAPRAPRGLPQESLLELPDHILIDIGVDPRDVARPAEQQADRLGLLDRGWQPRRLPRR
ncbi:hypothetical protein [Mesorhizobium sp. SP-1A]|uniref:hypothetical protein n=1 Tax=Mesorhizobium sp. SP-1A TaxID=3077840 RepID=UPI0028F6F0C5|nr:hypothetical protein [Mesorhizobium sp. SP-1A]